METYLKRIIWCLVFTIGVYHIIFTDGWFQVAGYLLCIVTIPVIWVTVQDISDKGND